LEDKGRAVSEQQIQQWQQERSELIQESRSREQQLNAELQNTREKLVKTQLAHDKVQAQLFKISDSTCIRVLFFLLRQQSLSF
jgi:hypothetical protein